MKSQEKFFYDQIEIIQKDREEKECEFEKLLQEERAKARQCDVDSGSTENHRLRWVTDNWLDDLLSFLALRYDHLSGCVILECLIVDGNYTDEPCHVLFLSNLSQNSEMLFCFL